MDAYRQCSEYKYLNLSRNAKLKKHDVNIRYPDVVANEQT